MKTKYKPFPALCQDCKHSKVDVHSSWINKCFQEKVVSSDSSALANNCEGQPAGVECGHERRNKSFFAPCGMKAKLWEAK